MAVTELGVEIRLRSLQRMLREQTAVDNLVKNSKFAGNGYNFRANDSGTSEAQTFTMRC